MNTNLDLNLTAAMILASDATGDALSASTITKTTFEAALASYAGASIQSRFNSLETTCYSNTASMALVSDVNGDTARNMENETGDFVCEINSRFVVCIVSALLSPSQ